VRISGEVMDEVNAELEAYVSMDEHLNWSSNVIGRMFLEDPRLARVLSIAGPHALHGGAIVYEIMQRQARKDALAAMEAER